MAKSNDDLANALNSLAAGEVQDDHHQSGTGMDHHHEAAPPPAAPPAARPPSVAKPTPKPVAPQAVPQPQQPPQRAARPAGPVPTPPPAAAPARPAAPPVQRAAAPAPQRPAAPSRPAAPQTPATPPPVAKVARPSAPARPAAPAAPPPPVVEEEHAAYEEGADALEHGQMVEGEELDIQAPTADVFRAKPKAAPKPRTKYTHKIEFKQTIIPIMLTIGVLSLISSVIPKIAPSDSNLGAMGDQTMLLVALAVVGLLFVAFGVLNALQVKSLLAAEKKL